MVASTKTWINNAAPSVEDDDLNGFNNENRNLIVGSGQTPLAADNQQTNKAVTAYAMVAQFTTGGGIADAYTLTAAGARIAPDVLIDGMVFRAIFPNNNTGASTVNPFASGVINIKLAGGINDPSAGQIKAGREAVLVYRTSPGIHAELIQSGMTNLVSFTSSGTYTPPDGLKSIKITATGGGGGGGGVDGQDNGTTAISAGGASAATSFLTTDNIDASYTIVIGAGGAGGASGNNSGVTGGNTTVVSTNVNISAGGGGGGEGMLGTSGSQSAASGVEGAPSGGDVNVAGSRGVLTRVEGGDPASFGQSAGSFWGGELDPNNNGESRSASVFGASGSGAFSADSTANFAGGNGFQGIVIIEEFF